MSQRAVKYLGKSKYKGVVIYTNKVGEIYYRFNICINGTKTRGTYKTEKECAIAYDMVLINNGKEPVNILKRT